MNVVKGYRKERKKYYANLCIYMYMYTMYMYMYMYARAVRGHIDANSQAQQLRKTHACADMTLNITKYMYKSA